MNANYNLHYNNYLDVTPSDIETIIPRLTKIVQTACEYYNKKELFNERLAVAKNNEETWLTILEFIQLIKRPDTFCYMDVHYNELLEFIPIEYEQTDCNICIDWLPKMEKINKINFVFLCDTIYVLYKHVGIPFWQDNSMFERTVEYAKEMPNYDQWDENDPTQIEYFQGLALEIDQVQKAEQWQTRIKTDFCITPNGYIKKWNKAKNTGAADLYLAVKKALNKSVNFKDFYQPAEVLAMTGNCGEESVTLTETTSFLWLGDGEIMNMYEENINQHVNEFGLCPPVNENWWSENYYEPLKPNNNYLLIQNAMKEFQKLTKKIYEYIIKPQSEVPDQHL